MAQTKAIYAGYMQDLLTFVHVRKRVNDMQLAANGFAFYLTHIATFLKLRGDAMARQVNLKLLCQERTCV